MCLVDATPHMVLMVSLHTCRAAEPDDKTETKYQIENTGAKIILVEPVLLDIALEAANLAKFSKDRIFLFSDEPCQPIRGIQDWSTFLGTAEEAQQWKWERMSEEESRTRTAVLNYSSGYGD